MSIMKDINYVTQLYTIPCGVPDWWVIAETAFAAAPPALLSILAPGCNDIVKMRAGLSPWHARSIKSLIRGAIKPFPVSELKFLYKIGYFTAEKYLWWFLLADVTKEFFITWQTMIYQQQQCQLPGAGTAYGRFLNSPYNPHHSQPVLLTFDHDVFGIIVTAGGFTVRPGFEANFAYTIDWETFPDPSVPADVETSLLEIGTGAITNVMRTNTPGLKNGSVTGGHLYHQKIVSVVPTQYVLLMANNGDTIVRPRGGTFSIGLSGRRAGNLTWGCNLKPVEWPFPNPLA